MTTTFKKTGAALVLGLSCLAAAGCTTNERTVGGALIGGTGGAILGDAVGGTGGAIGGAILGGSAGAVIGRNTR